MTVASTAPGIWHRGGCHCGAVRFEVEAPATLEVLACNCSICRMTGYLHLIVPRSRFRLVTPMAALGTYTFHTGAAQHHFCTTCGVKSWYVPRSHPGEVSVNARCLEPGSVVGIQERPFDGQNWEEAVEDLREGPGGGRSGSRPPGS
jgi:hypothetical protein